MKRTYIKDLKDNIGKEIAIAGWVDVRRDHGKLIFIDLRDMSGKVQIVVLPNHEEAHKAANSVRPEWVIEIIGKVNERPEKMVNKDEANGSFEIEALSFSVLNKSKTPPFEITEDTKDVEETTRLKYRYLDLRTKRMQRNIKIRSSFVQKCREYLFKENFTEIETPLLTESTAEGSRDFIVPSRLHPGKFYALPQSPQQYKQLLMTSGFEKYFQIARAIRDEDLRADRGFEHSQIDIEMSFVKEEDVMDLVEDMITKTVENMGYVIKEKPFPKIPYSDAIKKYGADKFDLRTEDEKKNKVLAYAWVVDFPLFEKTDEGKWTFSHNPFSMPKENHIEWLKNGNNIEKIISSQYDLVCNGYEIGGGSIRSHDPDILRAVYKTMGYSDEEVEKSVGHMIEAYEYGTPPHGGLALGIERIIMNLTEENSLREVQAFPMTRSGHTSVMKGPSKVLQKHLTELGISIDENLKEKE